MDAILGALKSKTMWASLGTIILGTIVPPVNAWIAIHPGVASTAVGLVFGILRMFTTQSLEAKGSPPGQAASP